MITKFIKLFTKPLKYQDARLAVDKKFKSSDLHTVSLWAKRQAALGIIKEYDANLALFSILKDDFPDDAISYGKNALSIKYDQKLAQAVEARIQRVKNNQEQEHKNWVASHNVTGLVTFSHSNTAEQTEQWLLTAIELNPRLEYALCKTFFNLFKDSNTALAVKYGRKVIELGADDQFEQVFNTRNDRLCKTAIKGLKYNELLVKITSLIEDGNNRTAFDWYQHISNEQVKSKLGKAIFTQFKNSNTVHACAFIKPLIGEIHDQKLIKVAAARFYSIKDMTTAASLYAKHLEVDCSELVIERFAISYSSSYVIEKSKINSHADIESSLVSLLPDNLSPDSFNAVVNWVLYLTLKDEPSSSKFAIDAAYALIDQGFSKMSLQLSKHLFGLGHIDKAISTCGLDPNEPSHLHQLNLLNGYKALLENGMPMPAQKHQHKGVNNKVLYTLYNSLPVHSAGYATRAHGLMTELRNKGYEFSAMTRLGYPQDLIKFRDRPIEQVEYVDNIAYYRLPTATEGNGFIPLDEYLAKYADEIVKHCQAHQVGVLHSASNFVNGIATNYAAKALGVKSIYEVRGLWEVTRMSRQPEWQGTEHYEMTKRLETESALYADHVITITEALKDEMVNRGVDKRKITVVPNGVDTTRFGISSRNLELESRLALHGQLVIGYVGSMVDYEGLDLLIKAVEILEARKLTGFKLLLIGDGAVKPDLERQVHESGLSDIVIFTGRVPHDSVEHYYSLIDICPFPRKALPVCEMVSPLKPFEAMAMGKVVVSSDVAALAEIVKDGVTGLLHRKDDPNDLANKIEQLIMNPELRSRLGLAAREWVVAERDWKVIAKRVDTVYRNLLGQ
ncbi:glycosyltransferase family 4 protein [Aeromonas veronii]